MQWVRLDVVLDVAPPELYLPTVPRKIASSYSYPGATESRTSYALSVRTANHPSPGNPSIQGPCAVDLRDHTVGRFQFHQHTRDLALRF